MQGTFAGQSVDNTTEKYVGPWLEALAQIRPEGVDIYTLARETPVAGLKKAPAETLERIAQRSRTWASALTGTDKESRLVGVVCQEKNDSLTEPAFSLSLLSTP